MFLVLGRRTLWQPIARSAPRSSAWQGGDITAGIVEAFSVILAVITR